MRWTIDSVAEAAHGTVFRTVRDPSPCTGVGIDTRSLRPAEVFVAVRGTRDGHEFLGQAAEAGAGAVLVDRTELVPADLDVPVVAVEDTANALLEIGRAARDRLGGAAVVGITGSVGKTSTKDLAAAAAGAARRTVANERSFNNELGVPLTLANAQEQAEVVVLEMGARGPGHVRKLCGVARPTIGVVTAVAPAHTETFGSLEVIAKAKSELVECLPSSGTAVLNADDPRVWAMRSGAAGEVLGYSSASPPRGDADVVALGLSIDRDLRPSFEVSSPWGRASVRLEARGAHQVGNALAALSVAALCGVDIGLAASALAEARLSPWRMEVGHTSNGATVINDAYNANPASIAAGLRALAESGAEERIAVLGPMAELGERSDRDHAEIAQMAARLGIRVVAVGTNLYGGGSVADVDEAAALLCPLGPTQAVLVKASRVAGLERLAARLLAC